MSLNSFFGRSAQRLSRTEWTADDIQLLVQEFILLLTSGAEVEMDEPLVLVNNSKGPAIIIKKRVDNAAQIQTVDQSDKLGTETIRDLAESTVATLAGPRRVVGRISSAGDTASEMDIYEDGFDQPPTENLTVQHPFMPAGKRVENNMGGFMWEAPDGIAYFLPYELSTPSPTDTELTINAGAITVPIVHPISYYTVDTENNASTDDLDSILGGSAGQVVILQAFDSARSIVVKDAASPGNLALSGDFTMDNAEDTIMLVKGAGDTWNQLTTSNNGA